MKDSNFVNPYSTQSPNINEKINFINRLYDEIHPTPKGKTTNNLLAMMSEVNLKYQDAESLNKS